MYFHLLCSQPSAVRLRGRSGSRGQSRRQPLPAGRETPAPQTAPPDMVWMALLT